MIQPLLAVWMLAAVVGPAQLSAPLKSPTPTAAEAITLPIKYEDGRVYVEARVGNGPAGWFILDTGASPTIVEASYAQRAKLPRSDPRRVSGAGAGASTNWGTTPIRLNVGAIALDVREPRVMDLAKLLGPTSGRNPAGIIGSQFFAEHTVELDFQAREMRVWPRGTDRSQGYAYTVPLTFLDGVPLTRARLTLPRGGSVDANVLVDLGAKSTLLVPEPTIAKQRLDVAFPGGVTLPLGAGVGGNTYYRFVRAPALAIAGEPGLSLTNPVIGLSANGSLKSEWHEGLLGAEYLARFRVGFDYSRSSLFLTRVDSHPAELDRSGIFIVWNGDERQPRFFVRDVLRDGPGAQAGVQAGDEIVGVGNRSTAHLSLHDIRRMLATRMGSVSVSARRNHRSVQLAVQLRDLV